MEENNTYVQEPYEYTPSAIPPKKSRKAVIIIIIASVVLILALVGFFIAACGFKSGVSADTFKSKAEARGYTVQMQTPPASFIKTSITVNTIGHDDVFMYFYELNPEGKDRATERFESTKESIQNNGTVFTTSFSGINYSTFSAKTSDGKFVYMACVENTLFQAQCEGYKEDELKEFIKDIGY